MPNNWKTYKLEDLVTKLGDGLHGTPKYSNDGDYYFINGNNLTDGKIEIKKDTKRVTKEEYLKHKKDINENTLFVSINGTIGNVGTYNGEKVILGKSACYFNIKKDVDKEFIKQIFSSKLSKDYLENNATGTTIQNVSLKTMREFPINLPSLKEQQSIAFILSAIDDKIENNLAINKTLEEMAMSLYKHWFVDFGPFQDGEFVESELGMIPKGWEVKSVYDIATYVNGAAFKPSELIEEGKYVIKISELNGGISKNTGKSVKEVKPEQIIKDGSVLFSWSATLDIFLWDRGEALLNQHIFNVLPNNTLSKEVLYFLLKNIIAYFKAIAADRATTMGHIKITHLKETLISIPNKEIQIEIDRLFKPLFDQILENLTENQTLTQLRDSLLPQLISGAVRLKEFRE